MSKPVLSDQLARWYLQFQQFEIVYIPPKAINGEALADFLADHPIPDDWELTDKLPDEDAMVVEVQLPWKMYFDGAAHRGGDGVSVVPPPNEVEGEKNKLKHPVVVSEVEKEEWRQPIINYLCYGILVEISRRRTEIRRRTPRFLYYKDTLYRRSFEGVPLDALGKKTHSMLCKKRILGYVGTPVWTKTPLPYKKDGILLANDVVALKEVKKENVESFIRVNIIYRFGIPHYIITDNGKSFHNILMNKICDLFGFKQRNSSMYNVAANGLAEAFNKTLCNLLKEVIFKSKRDWNDRITDEENARLRLAELEALDEKRLEVQQSIECYQARLSCAFNKRVCPRSFNVGDQVLVVRRPIIISHKPVGNFTSKWDESYVIQEAYSSGAYKLVDADGMRIGPINGCFQAFALKSGDLLCLHVRQTFKFLVYLHDIANLVRFEPKIFGENEALEF
ncbi:uncharacterized protein [Nicotiana sylvestris]|uniref:uncharacterized protein n=1 Tax=Nicotiana sylvestris TaxID=4096 RepID=UPI00388CE4D6